MIWQPIETAPKDGSDILVYCPPVMSQHLDPPEVMGCAITRTACWLRDHWCIDGEEYPDSYPSIPTHWQPLPEPPTAEEGTP